MNVKTLKDEQDVFAKKRNARVNYGQRDARSHHKRLDDKRIESTARTCVKKARSMSWNERLRDIYYDPHHPGALSGVNNIYKYAKHEHPTLKRNDAVKWLRGEKAYTVHRPTRMRFR